MNTNLNQTSLTHPKKTVNITSKKNQLNPFNLRATKLSTPKKYILIKKIRVNPLNQRHPRSI